VAAFVVPATSSGIFFSNYGSIGAKKHQNRTCGPAQLNIHIEGVSDHGDTHDLFFSGLSTFLKQSVDSVGSLQRHCWQCLHTPWALQRTKQKFLP
jgi:hypothetical protein